MIDPARELEWLRRLRDLSHQLATERDVEQLLPTILDAAIDLAEAERGFLVRVATGTSAATRVKVAVARGFAKETLQGAQGKVSRTVVERALAQDRAVLTTSEEDADVREVSSVQARRVLSILCVPMRHRGRTVGVLYLDHRFSPTAFTEQDVPIVEAFADQAALAIETAERAATERRPPAHDDAQPAPAPPAEPADEAVLPPELAPAFFGGLIGSSPAMQRLYREIERAAGARAPVLITGESGTGKELVAREIHARSDARDQPFLSENCAAIADALLESELFGHRRGAFTGATADRDGLFVLAGAGTLFLDEVGDMSPVMQRKLLRVLQEGRVRPVGADQDQAIRCRVLAATHHDLRKAVAAGAFREDLYYRLDVLRIAVPTLRERPGDVPGLLEHFLAQEGVSKPTLTPKALELLCGYAWPGNVRELENEARRLAALGERRITARQISADVRDGRGLARAGGPYSGKTLHDVEREMVAAALREANGNKAQAARRLGIPKTSLYHLLDRYGLR